MDWKIEVLFAARILLAALLGGRDRLGSRTPGQ